MKNNRESITYKRHPESHNAARVAYTAGYTAIRAHTYGELRDNGDALYNTINENARTSFWDRNAELAGWINDDRAEQFEIGTRVTIPQLARELSYALHTITRHNGDIIYALKDDSPQWMSEIIHEVHKATGQGFLPSDTVYDIIDTCADALSNCDNLATDSELMDAIQEIEPDIYNADLFAWLAADLSHQYYVDEAVEEYGDSGKISTNIQYGQLAQIQEIGNALIEALRDESESR